ncbi:LysE family transporter [Pseudomonas lalucatii]|uniref:LysE family transporter n=1 Tax=Pseudomonas lalucatii TaxID=1424203 RepID=A0ABS5Q691_9PSED|nr:LysE family transporter [Pseudomonas lalucatii]MBS7664251.1 LysE family transporter [Pseudomonas lalucatii]
MLEPQTLAIFLGAATLLLLVPGPNMLFVVSHGVHYGWRGGVAAALGIGLADLILTLLTAAGVTGLAAAWPPSFDLIRYCGAAYLLWMAYRSLRSVGPPAAAGCERAPLQAVVLRAMFNSLLNPKALLFFILFLPQFVVPGEGTLAGQLLLLGGLLTLLALVFHAALGLFGGGIGRALGGRERLGGLHRWGLAGVLGLLALRLVLMPRPG